MLIHVIPYLYFLLLNKRRLESETGLKYSSLLNMLYRVLCNHDGFSASIIVPPPTPTVGSCIKILHKETDYKISNKYCC